MSRTDVHRPGWVKERDPYMRQEFVTDHDHRHGECDLAAARSTYGNPDTNCHRRYVGGRNIYCGCRMCTGHNGRRHQNGQARAAWRNDRQRLLAGLDERPAKRFASWF